LNDREFRQGRALQTHFRRVNLGPMHNHSSNNILLTLPHFLQLFPLSLSLCVSVTNFSKRKIHWKKKSLTTNCGKAKKMSASTAGCPKKPLEKMAYLSHFLCFFLFSFFLLPALASSSTFLSSNFSIEFVYIYSL
jgi:hypothetical protein